MTNLSRRATVAGLGTLFLAGCLGDAPPAALTVAATGQAGMNPGPDGTDRPVTVTVVQMSGTGAFNSADAFQLTDPQSALGAEFVAQEALVLAPGGTASTTIAIQPGVTAIGFVAGFRDSAGKVTKTTIAAPSGPAGATVSVSSSGLSVTAV